MLPGLTSAIYQDNDGESSSPAYIWQYSSDGTPRIHQDGYSNLKYYYSYDSIGRLIRTDISDRVTGAAVGSTEFGYNTRGHQTSVTNEIGGRTYEQQYVYSKLDGVEGSFENASDGLSTRYGALGKAVDYSYDGLNRLTYRSQNTTTPLTNEYSYATSLRGTGYTTTLISEEKINGVSYAYTYDSMGNISTIKRGGNDYHSYKYNALGQLVRDNSYTSGGGTYVWEYDGLGNILSKKKYTYTEGNVSSLTPVETINYEYGNSNLNGWRQLLKNVDLNGNDYVDENEKISYDEIGNPTTYLGATMSWYGRQLRNYSKNGISANFMYDADGLRSAKGVNGVKTTYQYVGDKLFYEKRGNNIELYYFYDSYGKLSAISYVTNGTATPFYVSTNSQGDVLSIHTGSGVKVAQYDYDAWGNATVMVVTTDSDGKYVYTTVTDESAPGHISTLNPIRYRGYYYDEDLELYYLQSRYYDAEIGRFINADGTLNGNGDIIGFNMYSYCSNNPVMFSDESGCGFWEDLKNFVTEKINNLKYKINRLFKEPLPYETVTDAAIASGTNLNERTQVTNLEYGQGITYDADTNSYGLTTTVTGEHASVNFSSILSDPSVVALVHSHPNCDGHIANEFSDTLNDGDMVYGDWVVANSNKKNIYLAAPNGNLYLMEWDVGEYNQSLVNSGLPIDDTPVECVF